ncbi:MAG: integrase [Gammaproteobacteria bacterium]|jgi:integrase
MNVMKQFWKAKRQVRNGSDPVIEKRIEKQATGKNIFNVIADEWHIKESGRWSKDHAERAWQTNKADALPYLGNMPIVEIKTRDVLHIVKLFEERGALDVAGRVSDILGKGVFTNLCQFIKLLIYTRWSDLCPTYLILRKL